MVILSMKKMVKNWIFIISFLFLGCYNSGVKNVDELIPRDDFKRILIDIENTQSILNSKIDMINYNHQDSLFISEILKDYNYSISSYETTLFFYIDQPEKMLEILEEVKDSLSF